MEIKNKMTVTREEGGKKGKEQVKENIYRTHGQRQQGLGGELNMEGGGG